jgi:hypothetical protein
VFEAYDSGISSVLGGSHPVKSTLKLVSQGVVDSPSVLMQSIKLLGTGNLISHHFWHWPASVVSALR